MPQDYDTAAEENQRRDIFPGGAILMFPHHTPPPPHLYSTHAVSQCRLLDAWPVCLMQMRLRRGGALRYQSQPCNHRK